MKLKRVLASILCVAMVLSTMVTVAFAEDADVTIIPTRPAEDVSTGGLSNNEFEKTWHMPRYDWEKEAVGIYVGGIKVEETGYYTYTSSGEMSTYGTLVASDETNYNVYVNLEEYKIVLNGLNMEVKAGPMPYLYNVAVEKYPHQVKAFMADGNTGVPGVLVITEGTYRTSSTSLGRFNWQSICYVAEGYQGDYEFGAIGLGIMDSNNWTVELIGENTIDVYSEFARPLDSSSTGDDLNQDAGTYAIYAEAGLTVTGEGSLNADVQSNWGNPYNEQNTSVAGIWSEGNLAISEATITVETSAQKQNTIISNEFQTTLLNPLAAIGSGSVVSIESGNITATDKTDLGSAIKGSVGVEISGGTVVADNDADIAGAAISSYIRRSIWTGEEGGYVNISGGDVTATATSSEAVIDFYANNEDYSGGAPGIGIAVGSNYNNEEGLGVVISSGTVSATGSGAGISANNSSVTVSGGDVTATAEATGFEDGGAVVADRGTVSLAAGTYNTTLPDSFIAEDSAIVDGAVMTEDEAVSSAWTARLGDGTYYTGDDGADKAIANANVDRDATENNTVWLTSSSSTGRSGLSLGDTLTIYVAEGAEYTGEFTGDKLIAKVDVGTPVSLDGTAVLDDGSSSVIKFTPYTYTMVVDPAYANIKVVREGAEDQYFLEFGNDYDEYTACGYMEHGDTAVLLNDIDLGTTSLTIRDFVTFDFNGHTITADYRYYALYISSRETGTITFTDTSDAKNGGVVNTGTGNAISNSFGSVTLVFENGKYSTASTTNPVVKTKVGQITGGTFDGTIEGFEVSGGTFSVDPTAHLADGYAVSRNAEGYAVIADTAAAEGISIEYKDVTVTGTEGEKTYEIVVKANDDDMINELASVDLSFAFTKEPVANGAIDITVAPATDFTMTRYENTNRYMFNYNGVTAVEGTANAIPVGTITVTGYGSYTIATADADTNIVNATTVQDNLVDSYTVAGAEDDDNLTGALVINKDTVADDGMVGEITNGEIAVPVRTLTINIDFPNAINGNDVAYQDMKVEIAGNIDGVNKTVTYDLGETTEGGYVVTNENLVLNNAYTVTVSGAGYRTARYTVTMTEDKTLRFWNNVMDEAQVVEIGKDSSAAKVTFLAGDIVKDNNINIYDLSAVVSYFGTENLVSDHPDYAKYDLNRDGVIDSKDVAYVLVSWGN